MARTNIFQRLADHDNIANDVDRIDTLFSERETIRFQMLDYTIVDFVNENCFPYWKNRGHCLDVDDYLDKIGYADLMRSAEENIYDFISLVEIVLNFYKMVCEAIEQEDGRIQTYIEFDHLNNIMLEDLSHINHKAIYDTDHEQVLIIEDKPEITAVAELVESDLSIGIVRYNHRALAGDIDAKKSILLQMGADLEPRRNEIKSFNKQLADDIFYMLNTMNIRHNNCDSVDVVKYKKFVAEMSGTDLESWYDELYQMMLLAYLELDQQKRNQRVKDLKSSIEGAS